MGRLRELIPRFSLRTLVIFTLLCTCSFGLWWHWEPWYYCPTETFARPNGRPTGDLLDGMLDFGFDAAMVGLYKNLCRYYFEIDPKATASYVYAYRDMWDEEEQAKGEGET